MTSATYQIADLLLDRYEVVRKTSEGKQAEVFLGHDRDLDVPVAIKVLKLEAALEPGSTARRRFRDEVEALRRLKSPHIPRVRDDGFCPHSGRPFLVTDWIPGKRLANLPLEGLSLAQRLGIAAQVAAALAEAHERGIVHRDVKSDNILVKRRDGEKSCRAWLVDFGIAQQLDSAAGLTSANVVLGGPAFVAPERVRGGKAGPESDVYSLGVVLYWLVTGVLPFEDEDSDVVFAMHVHREPGPPSELATLPARVERLVLDCLAKDPRERATARELVDLLREPGGATSVATGPGPQATLPVEPLPPETDASEAFPADDSGWEESPAEVSAAPATGTSDGKAEPKGLRRRAALTIVATVAATLVVWTAIGRSGAGLEAPRLLGLSPAGPADTEQALLTGAATPDTEVVVYATRRCRGPIVATARTSPEGRFAVAVAVDQDAENWFSAALLSRSDDGARPCSAPPLYLVEDSTAPADAAPFRVEPIDDGAALVAGRAEADAVVRLFTAAGCAGNPALETRVDGNGDFEARIALEERDVHAFYPRVRDRAGLESPCPSDPTLFVTDLGAAQRAFFIHAGRLWQSRLDGSDAEPLLGPPWGHGTVSSYAVSANARRAVALVAFPDEDAEYRLSIDLVSGRVDAEPVTDPARICDVHPAGDRYLTFRGSAPTRQAGGSATPATFQEVSLASGATENILEVGEASGCATYASGGSELLYATVAGGDSQIVQFERSGRARHDIATLPGWQAGSPVISPDGNRVAVVVRRGDSDQAELLSIPRGERGGIEPLPLVREPGLSPDRIAWSPDGTSVLYALDDQGIFAVARAGGRAVLLAADGAMPSSAAYVAPDSFTRRRHWIYVLQSGGIARVRPDGSALEPVTLAPGTAAVRSLAVSADGRQIAYGDYHGRYAAENRVVIITPQGDRVRSPIPVGSMGTARVCAFHPISDWLLSAIDVQPGRLENVELIEHAMDGDGVRRLTRDAPALRWFLPLLAYPPLRHLSNLPRNDGCGAYSPDGRYAVFANGPIRCGDCAQLVQVATDGGGVELFPVASRWRVPPMSFEHPPPVVLANPRWSPDGELVAATERPLEGREDLVLLRPDGTTHSVLTNTPDAEGAPAWSPDGSSLAYGRGGEVWVMFADGSGAAPIAQGSDPVWVEERPQGRRLLRNGSFDRGLLGWEYDEHRGPPAPQPSVIDRDGHRTALRLNTLAVPNDHYAYRQSVPLDGLDPAALELSWWWRVDTVEEPYGQATIQLELYGPDAAGPAAVGEVRRTGGASSARCPVEATAASSEPTSTLCRRVDDAMPIGHWRFDTLAVSDLLEAASLPSTGIENVEVVIDSFNNASEGVDLYVDEVSLTVAHASER